ncbi:MAG: hypothetical protein JWQ83_1, partial [Lacunisphaera sp.]|nr:hypothetical protein [Lacunisphaera sp.]
PWWAVNAGNPSSNRRRVSHSSKSIREKEEVCFRANSGMLQL